MPNVREGQLPRVDHGRDRPRDRSHRARALPAFRLEARALPRLSRLRLAAGRALLWEKAIADEAAPANGWLVGKAYLEARAAARIVLMDLWIQALTEAADDPEIRRGFGGRCARCTSTSRRDPPRAGGRRDRRRARRGRRGLDLHLARAAEHIDHRLGNIVGDEFDDIVSSRREWMTGLAP